MRTLSLALLTAALACGPKTSDPGDTDGTSGTGPAPGTSSTSVTTTDASTTASVSGDSSGGSSTLAMTSVADSSSSGSDATFILPADATHHDECHQSGEFVGVCGEGSKCTIKDGLTDTHCQPVASRPQQRGEPCSAQSDALDGLDDCAEGLFCWELDDQGQGICRELCVPGYLGCTSAGEACVNLACQSCIVSWCAPVCDPLVQDCPAGELCSLGFGAPEQFICQSEQGPAAGGYGAPCVVPADCAPGLGCLGESAAEAGDFAPSSPACAEDPNARCCTPFCDASQPTCPDADEGVECVVLGAEGHPNTGVCLVPAP